MSAENSNIAFDGTGGLSANLAVKAAIAERLVFIKYFAYECEDQEMLRWVRNQVSEPYTIIQRKLSEFKKDVATDG